MKITVLNPQEVPEVQRYLKAQSDIENFKKRHPKLFEELGQLVEEHNAALEAADKVLRARQASSGPFDLFTITTKYDAEKLFEELGEKDFIDVGGVVKKETVYELNEALFKAMVERGTVPKEVADAVTKETPKYHKPAKFEIP